MRPEVERLRGLGFSETDAETLVDHFLDAETRGKLGHGRARIEWLATQQFDPAAKPVKTIDELLCPVGLDHRPYPLEA